VAWIKQLTCLPVGRFSKQNPNLRKIREDFPGGRVEAIDYEPMLATAIFPHVLIIRFFI